MYFVIELYPWDIFPVWWWKDIIKSGNPQVTGTFQRNETCPAWFDCRKCFLGARGDNRQRTAD